MTGKTIAGLDGPAGSPALRTRLTVGRAARELGLRRGEFDLAVRLGRIRTVTEPARGPEPPGTAATRRRVARVEIDRLRAAEGFPEALRAGVRTVSAPQAARELGITTERFTKLARLGLLTPVAFYVNRYRTVVWLYLAEELGTFAAVRGTTGLLTDRLPETMRSQLDTGIDLRARNWRGRHAGFLLRLAEDAWAGAAVTASLLDEDEIADVVDDPFERAYLTWLKPERPDQSPPGSLAAHVVDELLTADDPEEIHWLRASLSRNLAEARMERPAPRFAPEAPPSCGPGAGRPDGGPTGGVGGERPGGGLADGRRAGTGPSGPVPCGDEPPVESAGEPPGPPRRRFGRLRRHRQ
jgi:hypothetical protein